MPRHTSPSQRTNPNAIPQFFIPEAPTSPPLTVDIYDAPTAQVASACSARRTRNLALALVTLAALAGAFLLTLAYPASSAQDAPDLWVAAAMRTPRNSHSLTELLDGRVLAAGGWDGTAPLASAELFDPAQQAWRPTGALSETRAYHTAARLPDGRVLVAGGWDLLGHVLTSTEVYDPAAGAWAPAAALQGGRAGHIAVALLDGRILAAAGCAETGVRRDAEVYDPKVDAWQAAGDLAEGRCGPTATVLADGRVLVVGGRDPAGQALASTELYDPAQNVWLPAGRLTTPREGHTATRLPDGRVLVVGGFNGAYLASAEVYDPVKNSWTPTGALRLARAYHAAALLGDGQVWVAGGSAGSRPSLETETYHPESGQWASAGPLAAAYESHLVTILDDGSVLISGRPDSGDVTGNDGYPTPTPGTPTPRSTRMHRPADWRLTPPPPTATPKPSGGKTGATAETLAAAALPNPDAAGAAAASTTPIANFSTGEDTAALYGTHEISFTLAVADNPYATPPDVTFTPQNAPGTFKTVKAFYDGAKTVNTTVRDVWVARVYVDQVGPWTWTRPAGARDPFTDAELTGLGAFSAVEQPGSGLRGMLRVAAGSSGAGKRWYTDDGRTFVPMADTAYRLFFDTPPGGVPGSNCPPVRSTAVAKAFVEDYADAVESRGVNVLRVESLGTWAYASRAMPTPGPTPAAECETDLSLFWSTDRAGSNTDLFNADPTIAQLATPAPTRYPNLRSFQTTDAKLKALLESHPGLYVQMILVPEPEHTYGDHTWIIATPTPGVPSINPTFREQLWRTMVARWAAFPNVFWSISNDLGDTKPNNQALAKEIGCYWSGPGNQAGSCSGLPFSNFGNDPWRVDRPLSMGHLRYAADALQMAPWHNYITVYTGADISAQQMDGARRMPSTPAPTATPTSPGQTVPLPTRTSLPLEPYHYSDVNKPSFNTEDFYEGGDGTTPEFAVPSYFFRRLFWSHLLSGSGATYGAEVTWPGTHTYSTGVYTTKDANGNPVVNHLSGLDSISVTVKIMESAHVDLALYKPNDALATKQTGSVDWAELERAQVAARDKQELLVYIPNSITPTPPVYWHEDARRNVVTNTLTSARVTLDMSAFTDPNYVVTWYDPRTGITSTTTSISGSQSAVSLQAPAGLTGDAVVHISSRCTGANKCLWMDELSTNPMTTSETIGDFWVSVLNNGSYTSTIRSDTDRHVIGKSWFCQGICGVSYNFGAGGVRASIASTDVYFRSDTLYDYADPMSYLELFFVGGWSSGPDTFSAGILSNGRVYGIACSAEFQSPDWPYNDCQGSFSNESLVGRNRWYRLGAHIERKSSGEYVWTVTLDGAQALTGIYRPGTGDIPFYLVGVSVDTLETGPTIWLDELAVDPVFEAETPGLLRAFLQQGLGGYTATTATYFNYTSGYNNTSQLHVGANNGVKSLLRFDLTGIPATAVIDEAILQLYNTGRSNGNTLTLGAHGVLAEWLDAEANRTQRQVGVNWSAPGMAGGSDYTAAAAATANITGAGSAWIDLNMTGLAQTWVDNPASNLGLVLLQETASGYVTYDFCSELGWSPCTVAQAPKLTLRYHLAPPPPVKATFQQGANGYTGTQATYFDGSGSGYNASPYLRVDASGSQKALLHFDLPTLPITATVDEATLRLYQTGRSNANTLTLAAHGVLADWTDSQTNQTQRQTGVNWQTIGLGSGSDYAAEAAGTADLASAGGAWIDLDVKALVQAWAANPAANQGLVLLAQTASGAVTDSFCSELGWSPCTAAQAPQLTVWYH